MERLILRQPKFHIPLWGLIHDNRYADNAGKAYGSLFSKSHFSEGQQVDGLLLFASPLHADIYRLQLEASGNPGWRCFCTSDSNIVRLIREVREDRLQLWIVAGFAASETQQILLDEGGMPMTSSIGIDVLLRRDEEDETALCLPHDAVRILASLIDRIAGMANPDRNWPMLSWPYGDDEACDEYACAALDQVATLKYTDYQKIWRSERPAVALALFGQIVPGWAFVGSTASQWH